MTNPFAPTAPAPAPGNPFGQPAPQTQTVAPPSPFGQPGTQGSSAWPQGAAPAPQAQSAAQRPAPPALPTSLGAGSTPPPPPVGGGGTGADLVAMFGRLVLVLPHEIEHGLVSKFLDPQTNQPRRQSRLTATFVVLDGDNPIPFGGNPYAMPPVPHSKSEPLPHVSPRLWVSQAKLIAQCSEQLAVTQAGGQGMVLGRLTKEGPDRNSAWVLDPATDADREIANYYLAGVASGQFPNPLA